MHFSAFLLGAALPAALAVFADEAYTVDFHYALLGLPIAANTFFHQPRPDSKASLLYTLSERNVIGAVNPKDGSLVWRQALDSNGTLNSGILRTATGLDTIVSGVGPKINSWVASDGKSSWTHSLREGSVKSLEVFDNTIEDAPPLPQSIVALLDGTKSTVISLSGLDGSLQWTFEDESGDVPFRVATSPTVIYYVSLQSTMLKGLKTKITSIEAASGKKIQQYTVSSEADLSSPNDIVFVGGNSAAPFIVWTDEARKTLKVNVFGSKTIESFSIPYSGSVADVQVKALSSSKAAPHFLVQYQSDVENWAEVYHINAEAASVNKVYELPKATGKGAFSVTTTENGIYFTRTTQRETILFSSTSADSLGSWPLSAAFESSTEVLHAIHSTTEVVQRPGSKFAVRSAVLLSNGDWTLIKNGERGWNRAESMAGTFHAAWAELQDQPGAVEDLVVEAQSNVVAAYVHRLKRHIVELRNLVTWLQSLPQFALNIISGHKSNTISTLGNRFGFHKIAVLATGNGRLIALDVGESGKILWNIKAIHLRNGETWDETNLGDIVERAARAGKTLIMIGNEDTSSSSLTSLANDVKGPVHNFNFQDGMLLGKKDGVHTWTFTPGPDSDILSITTALQNEPVASIGKVLGDRQVLYKYLNPNTALVIAAKSRSITAYLLDTGSGEVLHSIRHTEVDTTRPITSAVSENWFTYSFTTEQLAGSISRGYQIVMVEMYESSKPDDRGVNILQPNLSDVVPRSLNRPSNKPHVFAQVFHIAEEISHMAVTQTEQGITTRHLLVSLHGSNSIVSIPSYALDPRRPIGRDPVTNEMMEGLSKYSPMIELNPEWYLNHREEIFGVECIITTPSLLESTGLVFAYGLDIFGTRVTPSFAFDILGNSFNKVQLLLTVVALFVGTLIAAPFIQRKQTNALWSNS